jgi:predicted DsbA family dithiol-disulfide isomerase
LDPSCEIDVDVSLQSRVKNGMTSSSHRAQRLQSYATIHKPDVELPLTMKLFEEYHIQGIAPSDLDMLSRVAVEFELFGNVEAARVWLEGTECDEETKKGYMVARRLGVTGVPFFIMDNKFASSGALPVEDFVEVSPTTRGQS